MVNAEFASIPGYHARNLAGNATPFRLDGFHYEYLHPPAGVLTFADGKEVEVVITNILILNEPRT